MYNGAFMPTAPSKLRRDGQGPDSGEVSAAGLRPEVQPRLPRAGPEREKQLEPRPTPLVLIVDDYQDAREMLKMLLSLSGYRTAQASTGFEAIERARDLLPAIILMDLAMPGLDGWEATRRLKSDERTRGIPVIAVTGHSFVDLDERASQAGCLTVLQKPVDGGRLLDEIRRALERAGGHDR